MSHEALEVFSDTRSKIVVLLREKNIDGSEVSVLMGEGLNDIFNKLERPSENLVFYIKLYNVLCEL